MFQPAGVPTPGFWPVPCDIVEFGWFEHLVCIHWHVSGASMFFLSHTLFTKWHGNSVSEHRRTGGVQRRSKSLLVEVVASGAAPLVEARWQQNSLSSFLCDPSDPSTCRAEIFVWIV